MPSPVVPWCCWPSRVGGLQRKLGKIRLCQRRRRPRAPFSSLGASHPSSSPRFAKLRHLMPFHFPTARPQEVLSASFWYRFPPRVHWPAVIFSAAVLASYRRWNSQIVRPTSSPGWVVGVVAWPWAPTVFSPLSNSSSVGFSLGHVVFQGWWSGRLQTPFFLLGGVVNVVPPAFRFSCEVLVILVQSHAWVLVLVGGGFDVVWPFPQAGLCLKSRCCLPFSRRRCSTKLWFKRHALVFVLSLAFLSPVFLSSAVPEL